MKQLTEEQRKKLIRAAMKFQLKSVFNGVQHGIMAIAMNFILTMVNIQYFENDNFVQIVGCASIIIFILMRLSACQRENLADYQKIVKEITE